MSRESLKRSSRTEFFHKHINFSFESLKWFRQQIIRRGGWLIQHLL